jgi:hypothetical protein
MQMTIRQWIAEHQLVAVIVILAALAGSVLFAIPRLNPRPTWKVPTEGYFTTDDGATCFAESLTKIPPFEHDGKEAVRDFVYSCDGGEHRWVAYLGKYGPEDKQAIESGNAKAEERTMLVRAPGSDEWISQTSPKFAQIFVKPPPGIGSGPPAPVSP